MSRRREGGMRPRCFDCAQHDGQGDMRTGRGGARPSNWHGDKFSHLGAVAYKSEGFPQAGGAETLSPADRVGGCHPALVEGSGRCPAGGREGRGRDVSTALNMTGKCGMSRDSPHGVGRGAADRGGIGEFMRVPPPCAAGGATLPPTTRGRGEGQEAEGITIMIKKWWARVR